MAANTASDSDSSREERADEAKRLGANFATPEKAKIAIERKI